LAVGFAYFQGGRDVQGRPVTTIEKSYMRKTIRRLLPKDEKKYQHEWHAKIRRPRLDKAMGRDELPSDRECPADRILGNQAMVQLLSLKLETEGEEATVSFLESLGCSDLEKVLQQITSL
jgi:hypothetical protein